LADRQGVTKEGFLQTDGAGPRGRCVREMAHAIALEKALCPMQRRGRQLELRLCLCLHAGASLGQPASWSLRDGLLDAVECLSLFSWVVHQSFCIRIPLDTWRHLSGKQPFTVTVTYLYVCKGMIPPVAWATSTLQG
jgi:hypothetical protein